MRVGLLVGVFFVGEFVCIYLGLCDIVVSCLMVFFYTFLFVVVLFLFCFVFSEKLCMVQWVGLVIVFVVVVVVFSEGFIGRSTLC